jgi:hypothetical protein
MESSSPLLNHQIQSIQIKTSEPELEETIRRQKSVSSYPYRILLPSNNGSTNNGLLLDMNILRFKRLLGLIFTLILTAIVYLSLMNHSQDADDLIIVPNPEETGHKYIGGKVNLTAFVMSKCPDAVYCEQSVSRILKSYSGLSEIIHFETQYIGKLVEETPSTPLGVECKHSEPEVKIKYYDSITILSKIHVKCLGNLMQLCVRDIFPDVSKWFSFVQCQNRDITQIPSSNQGEQCAKESGLESEWTRKIKDCIEGQRGIELLRKSTWISEKHAKVTKSCTLYINSEKRCVRDGGRWYDCPGGNEDVDLVKSICSIYKPLDSSKDINPCSKLY